MCTNSFLFRRMETKKIKLLTLRSQGSDTYQGSTLLEASACLLMLLNWKTDIKLKGVEKIVSTNSGCEITLINAKQTCYKLLGESSRMTLYYYVLQHRDKLLLSLPF